MGALFGDAMGVPHEFKNRAAIPPMSELNLVQQASYPKTYPGVPYGTWSDDGSQLLCVLATLMEHNGDCPQGPLACRLLRWFDEAYMQAGGRVYDCGSQTARALCRLKSGTPPDQAGGVDARSNGNGSLMRVLPVGLALAQWGRSLEDIVTMAMSQSRITHAHPISQVTCALYATLVTSVLRAPPSSWRQAANEAGRWLTQYFLDQSAPMVWHQALAKIMDHGCSESCEGSGYVVDTYWSSIWALEQARGSYLVAVRAAISLGNDTDTTASVTGGLAGAAYGLNVPAEWVDQLIMPPEALAALWSLHGD